MDIPTSPSPSLPDPAPQGGREGWTALLKQTVDPGFAVYVHWPFCQSKCPYCDFNSHVRAGGIDEARFLAGYLRELDHMAALTGPREVGSVFFGGGTPSLMPVATVASILERIAKNWSLGPDAEITLEANPTSVEATRFAGYRAAGVNRVSLGVQSLEDAALKALGRLHDAGEARAALELARQTFPRVSFDMIYARPWQSVAAWERELGQALSLGPDHLSVYQLTIEPGTAFAALHAAGRLNPPDEAAASALYEATQAICGDAGLPAYEISNHARPGEECRHNLVYWRMGEYAGAGPGAHGRIVVEDARHATATHLVPEDWLAHVERDGHGLSETAPLSRADMAEEMLLMGLRLTRGLDLARYAAIGGRLDEDRLRWLAGEGLIARTETHLRATRAGRLVLNAIAAELAE